MKFSTASRRELASLRALLYIRPIGGACAGSLVNRLVAYRLPKP